MDRVEEADQISYNLQVQFIFFFFLFFVRLFLGLCEKLVTDRFRGNERTGSISAARIILLHEFARYTVAFTLDILERLWQTGRDMYVAHFEENESVV